MIIIPDIPKRFTGHFLDYYKNTMQHFGFFSREEIDNNKGKLLMLDIDFGRYCSLRCPGCFRKSNAVDDLDSGDLSYAELLSVIDEARELGLQSVKICGAGESTQNVQFLQFLHDLNERDVGVAVFTKGQVLGSDEETIKYYGEFGIDSALDLCKRMYLLKTSFMLSYQSFDTEKQDSLVGGVEGHSLIRDKALENLAAAGFNTSQPTRLALELGPIFNETIEDVFDLYVYARERNIYTITNLLMVSGKQIDHDFLARYDCSDKSKLDLFLKIYSWNVDHGIQTLQQIREEGISCMPGIHPCNQVAVGLYITANGNVVSCPGFTYVEGNVRTQSIREIWEKSVNRHEKAGTFNCRCPPKDGITIPLNLYQEVLDQLERKYGD